MGGILGNEYLMADEIMKGGEPCNVSEGVRRQTILERDKWHYSNDALLRRGYTQKEIDAVEAEEPDWLREGRAWSDLGSQVVGAEI